MNTLSQYRINAKMSFRRTDTFRLLCSQLFSNYSIQARSYVKCYVKTATQALDFTSCEKLAQNLMFRYVSGHDYA